MYNVKYGILAEITNLLPINFSHYTVWLNKWSACETWTQVLHHYQNKGTPISCLPFILWHVSRTCSWLTIATMCTECSTDDLFSYYTWTFNGCNLYLCSAQYGHGLQLRDTIIQYWWSDSPLSISLPTHFNTVGRCRGKIERVQHGLCTPCLQLTKRSKYNRSIAWHWQTAD